MTNSISLFESQKIRENPMENQEKVHKRRVRYSGTHPRSYKEKYW